MKMRLFCILSNTVTTLVQQFRLKNSCTASFMIGHKSIDILYCIYIATICPHIALLPQLFYSMKMKFKMHMIISSGIKKKHLLCTQFSWVYCAMHNCNRGCIKLTRRGEKQSFSIPQKCSRKCAGNTTATHAMAREFMGHVWFGSCIILERFSSITIAMTCI